MNTEQLARLTRLSAEVRHIERAPRGARTVCDAKFFVRLKHGRATARDDGGGA